MLALLIPYAAMLAYDIPKLKKKNRRERFAYGVIMLCTLYLSLIYVLDTSWPNFDEAVNFFFAAPAKHIVEMMK
jgi:hypothetical protein